MLSQLTIHNILLIEALSLDFGPGLNVLTGETGAGKSILLDSLSMALGARAQPGLVRTGATQAQVAARFELPASHPALGYIQEQGLILEDAELVLRRQLKADGGSRAFINDQPVSLALLREVGTRLLELHGQQDDIGLLNPKGHKALLDNFANSQAQSLAVQHAWEALAQAQTALETAQARLAHAQTEADYVQNACQELEKLAPMPGEEQILAEARLRLQRNERAAEEVGGVLEHLSGSQGALARLRQAARRLERASSAAQSLTPFLSLLDRAIQSASEAEEQLQNVQAHQTADPNQLEKIETRLFDLRAAARKYRCDVDALPQIHAHFQAQVHDHATAHETCAQARSNVGAAHASFVQAARALEATHREAALALAKAVSQELAPLKLERAAFRAQISTLEPAHYGPGGVHKVVFEIATNPGAGFGPLNKIASGGELARFILALKVALAQANSAGTLIFDEVDRGVGGAVAAAIGERLARLAAFTQILLITHSPQVAACASHHYHIEKTSTDTGARTSVTKLDPAARISEIARMLSSDTITPEALAQAQRLLAASVL